MILIGIYRLLGFEGNLSVIVSPIFLATSAFLKSTQAFQILKGQNESCCTIVSEGPINFLFHLWRWRNCQDKPSRKSRHEHEVMFLKSVSGVPILLVKKFRNQKDSISLNISRSDNFNSDHKCHLDNIY